MADEWTEIYQNGPNGNRVSGSFDDLKSNVLRGADVKVGYTLTTAEGFFNFFWRRLCSATVTEELDFPNDPGNTERRFTVSGIVTDIPDTDVGPNSTGRVFAEPFAVEWHMFNTSGLRQVVKFDRQTQSVISNTKSFLQISWYIRS